MKNKLLKDKFMKLNKDKILVVLINKNLTIFQRKKIHLDSAISCINES